MRKRLRIVSSFFYREMKLHSTVLNNIKVILITKHSKKYNNINKTLNFKFYSHRLLLDSNRILILSEYHIKQYILYDFRMIYNKVTSCFFLRLKRELGRENNFQYTRVEHFQ